MQKHSTVKTLFENASFSVDQLVSEKEVFLKKLAQSNLEKSLQENLIRYFHSPSSVNFEVLRSKITLLVNIRKMLLEKKRFILWQESVTKLSVIAAVVSMSGTSEQKKVLNHFSIIKEVLGELSALKTNGVVLTIDELAQITVLWDEWFVSCLPRCLSADSCDNNQPDSVSGLLSSLLINHAVGQAGEYQRLVEELRTSGIAMLQWQGKRVYLKEWLTAIFSRAHGFDWKEHYKKQNKQWSSRLSEQEILSLIEFDQGLHAQIKVIVKMETHLDALKAADYLKKDEDKNSAEIVVQMEALADLCSEQAVCGGNIHWRDLIMSVLSLYMGVVYIISDPRWRLAAKEQDRIKNRMIEKIKKVEWKLLVGINAQRQEKLSWSKETRYRKQLEGFRGKAKDEFKKLIGGKVETDQQRLERAQQLTIFSEKLVSFVKTFLQRLIEASIRDLGTPPCEYAFIGFGSLEKHSVTPYSDIEFGILIADDTEKNKEFFRNLTYVLQAKVIQLGETPIPFSLFNYNFDHLTNSGFCFDLGGKISLGRRYSDNEQFDYGKMNKHYGDLKYELIGCPASLVRFVEDECFVVDRLLPVELAQCVHITGDEMLTTQYQRMLAKRFMQVGRDGRPFCEQRAMDLLCGNPYLEGDLDQFEIKLGGNDDEKLYNVKKEIYRLPDRLISDLAFFYAVTEGSTADKINRLVNLKVLSQDNANHLLIVDAISREIRLEAYFYYRSQSESMSVMPHIFEHEQSIFRFDKIAMLERYYQTSLVLLAKLEDFCVAWEENPKSVQGFFRNIKMRDTTLDTQLLIARKLGQKEKVHSLAKKITSRHPGDSDNWAELGVSYLEAGDCQRSRDCFVKQLAMLESLHGENYFEVGSALVQLASAEGGLGNWKTQAQLLDRALVIFERYYPDQEEALSGTLIELGGVYSQLGEAKKGGDYLERALKISERLYGPADISIVHCLDSLANSYLVQGDTKRCIALQHRVLDISRKHYGPEHPLLACIFLDLGKAYGKSGDWQRSIALQKDGLAIMRHHNTSDHIDIAVATAYLGYSYGAMGDAQKHLETVQPVIETIIRYYGHDHPKVSALLVQLSDAYGSLGEESAQVILLKKAAAIEKEYYGNNLSPQEFTLSKLDFALDDIDDEESASSSLSLSP